MRLRARLFDYQWSALTDARKRLGDHSYCSRHSLWRHLARRQEVAEYPKAGEAESPEQETSTIPGTRMTLLFQLSSDEPQPQQHQVVAGKAEAGRGMAEASRDEQVAEAEAVMAAGAAAVEYYYQAVDGQQHGPGKMQHLVHAWRQGSINASSLVWWSGQVGWAPLSQMPMTIGVPLEFRLMKPVPQHT